MQGTQHIPVHRERLVIEFTVTGTESISPDSVRKYLIALSKHLGMKVVMQPLCHPFAAQLDPEKYAGFEAWIVWAESGAQFYYWENEKFLTVDIYTCKTFSVEDAVNITYQYFPVSQLAYRSIPHVLEENLNNNPKASVSLTKLGKGVIAREAIFRGERIAVFDGEIYFAKSESQLPECARDFACPFHKYWYRDGKPNSLSRCINHSCEPNCGIKNLFEIVAMRDIGPNEELTIDYGMICDSDWENPEGKCLCGSPNCRGKILPYRDLPQDVKERYREYISEWLEK